MYYYNLQLNTVNSMNENKLPGQLCVNEHELLILWKKMLSPECVRTPLIIMIKCYEMKSRTEMNGIIAIEKSAGFNWLSELFQPTILSGKCSSSLETFFPVEIPVNQNHIFKLEKRESIVLNT